jgi:hypothetical protein
LENKKAMKAQLNFDLDEPDDIYAHKRAIKSLDLALALWSISSNLINHIERRVDAIEEKEMRKVTVDEVIEMFSNELDDTLMEHNIQLDELIL